MSDAFLPDDRSILARLARLEDRVGELERIEREKPRLMIEGPSDGETDDEAA